jgi:hypothetical protein
MRQVVLVEKKLIFMEKKQIGKVAAKENLSQNRLFPQGFTAKIC